MSFIKQLRESFLNGIDAEERRSHKRANTSLCNRKEAKVGVHRQHVYTYKLETKRGESAHGYTVIDLEEQRADIKPQTSLCNQSVARLGDASAALVHART